MQIRYQSDTLNVLTCHGINNVPIISYRSTIRDTFRFHKQNSNLIVAAINNIARTTFQQPLVKTIGFFSLKSVSTCTAVVWLQVQRFPEAVLVASFGPAVQDYLNICQNPSQHHEIRDQEELNINIYRWPHPLIVLRTTFRVTDY
ncbi:MAG TPA: hypothetical protein DCO83_16075 [Mucilaginibacter sp.]|jgi:hypothetical protein|nr:hypothetical protein [Mucilaginibacter sp.]